MRKILCVHQGYELYGSDRMFLLSLSVFRRQFPNDFITVVLPKEGPLSSYVKDLANEVKIQKLFPLRRSKFIIDRLSLKSSILTSVASAYRTMKQYDFIYINSIAVIDYIIASWFIRKKGIIHIHELPGKILGLIFSKILILSRFKVVFVSKASREAFLAHRLPRSKVLHNATLDRGMVPITLYEDCIHILVIGRLNSWKGQGLVVEGIAKLSALHKMKVKVRIVGSVYENEVKYRNQLLKLIRTYSLESIVELIPFQEDPHSQFQWCHVLVVPSLRPEPFGLVAIEAMSLRKPVIAAAHGGLCEIVEHERSGYLFNPGDESDLCEMLQRYLVQPQLLREHGEIGYTLFKEKFSEDTFVKEFSELCKK